jgi:hypothetical protein
VCHSVIVTLQVHAYLLMLFVDVTFCVGIEVEIIIFPVSADSYLFFR